MTAPVEKPRLALLGAARDYGARLSGARWRRRVGAEGISRIDPAGEAAAAFAGASWWIVVLDESAIPMDGSGARPPAGRVLGASAIAPSDPVHTLRELEQAGTAAIETDATPPALSFRTPDVPPTPGETAGAYVARLRAASRREDERRGFAAFRVPDASENARPEIALLVPASTRRLLDVGCGSGGFAAGVKRERPGLFVTGIEKDAAAAARARPRLDRVIFGDAREAIADLAAAGERFDTIVCADVLEHLEDPVSLLRSARSAAQPLARLVVSVPNVGHASLVRDLLHGRFDPVAAGLLDATHLRWFDRARLAETLEEAGWEVESIRGLPGAPAPDSAAFSQWAASVPAADRESLAAYQWTAVATAPAGAPGR